MEAGVGFSSAFSPGAAARAAVARARQDLGSRDPECAVVFATAAWGPALPELLEAVRAELGAVDFAGASVAGLFARGEGTADNPGIAVALMADCAAEFVLIDDLDCGHPESGEELLDHIDGPLEAEDLLLLAMDLHHRGPAPLLGGLARAGGPGLVVGIGASALPGGDASLWRGEESVRAGVLAIVLRGAASTHWGVAQGCRLISPVHTVTRARDRWVSSLDNRPVLEILREAAAKAQLDESPDALRQLLVEVEREGQVLCTIAGVDLRRGAILLPVGVDAGDRLRIAVRDAVAARENLEQVVAEHARPTRGFALYLSATAHGHGTQVDLARDARCFQQRAQGLPVLGVRAAQVLGPAGEAGRVSQPLAESSLVVVFES